MPRKRKRSTKVRKRRSTKRRKVYRTKKRGKGTATRGVKAINRAGAYLADKTIVKLKLSFILQFTNTTGSLQVALVCPNSLFDPMQSSGSLQPYLFDQYATLYNFYQVHGCSAMCKAFFGVTGVTSTSVREYGMCWSNSSSSLLIQNYRDQVFAKHKMIQFSGYSGNQMLKSYMPMNRLYGNSREQYVTNTNLQAAVGADPAVKLFLHFWTFDPFVGTDVNTNMQVDMTFYCEFNGRKDETA